VALPRWLYDPLVGDAIRLIERYGDVASWVRFVVGCRYEPAPVRYWDFAFEDDGATAPSRELIEELDRLFRQAVSRLAGGCASTF
jgi:hypothetical protein